MRYSEEYDSPVAGWCRIFRNFSIFARSRDRNDAKFQELESGMTIEVVAGFAGLSHELIEELKERQDSAKL